MATTPRDPNEFIASNFTDPRTREILADEIATEQANLRARQAQWRELRTVIAAAAEKRREIEASQRRAKAEAQRIAEEAQRKRNANLEQEGWDIDRPTQLLDTGVRTWRESEEAWAARKDAEEAKALIDARKAREAAAEEARKPFAIEADSLKRDAAAVAREREFEMGKTPLMTDKQREDALAELQKHDDPDQRPWAWKLQQERKVEVKKHLMERAGPDLKARKKILKSPLDATTFDDETKQWAREKFPEIFAEEDAIRAKIASDDAIRKRKADWDKREYDLRTAAEAAEDKAKGTEPVKPFATSLDKGVAAGDFDIRAQGIRQRQDELSSRAAKLDRTRDELFTKIDHEWWMKRAEPLTLEQRLAGETAADRKRRRVEAWHITERQKLQAEEREIQLDWEDYERDWDKFRAVPIAGAQPVAAQPAAAETPAAPEGVKEGSRLETEAYIAQPGDTRASVAAKFGITEDKLEEFNRGLSGKLIAKGNRYVPGEKLLIPKAEPAAPPEPVRADSKAIAQDVPEPDQARVAVEIEDIKKRREQFHAKESEIIDRARQARASGATPEDAIARGNAELQELGKVQKELEAELNSTANDLLNRAFRGEISVAEVKTKWAAMGITADPEAEIAKAKADQETRKAKLDAANQALNAYLKNPKKGDREGLAAALKEAGIEKPVEEVVSAVQEKALKQMQTARGKRWAAGLEEAVRERQNVTGVDFTTEAQNARERRATDAFTKVLDEVAALPPDEMMQALREIYASAQPVKKTQPGDPLWDRTSDASVQFARRVQDMAEYTRTAAVAGLRDNHLQEMARAKTLYWLDPAIDPMTVRPNQGVAGNVNRVPYRPGAADPYSEPLVREARILTPEEQAHVQETLQADERRRIAAVKLRDFSRARIEKGPLDETMLGRGALVGADLIGLVAPLALTGPAQFPAMAATFSGMNYERRMAAGYEPGMNAIVSSVGGVVDAYIERLTGFLSPAPISSRAGKLRNFIAPSEMLERWLMKRFGHTFAGKFGAAAADRVLGETWEEFLNQVNMTAGDAFMEALPDVDVKTIAEFKEEWLQFRSSIPEMLIGMAIVGGGSAFLSAAKNQRMDAARSQELLDALKDDTFLRAMGVTDRAARDGIMEAADTDPIRAINELRNANPDIRRPEAQTARAQLDQQSRKKWESLAGVEVARELGRQRETIIQLQQPTRLASELDLDEEDARKTLAALGTGPLMGATQKAVETDIAMEVARMPGAGSLRRQIIAKIQALPAAFLEDARAMWGALAQVPEAQQMAQEDVARVMQPDPATGQLSPDAQAQAEQIAGRVPRATAVAKIAGGLDPLAEPGRFTADEQAQFAAILAPDSAQMGGPIVTQAALDEARGVLPGISGLNLQDESVARAALQQRAQQQEAQQQVAPQSQPQAPGVAPQESAHQPQAARSQPQPEQRAAVPITTGEAVAPQIDRIIGEITGTTPADDQTRAVLESMKRPIADYLVGPYEVRMLTSAEYARSDPKSSVRSPGARFWIDKAGKWRLDLSPERIAREALKNLRPDVTLEELSRAIVRHEVIHAVLLKVFGVAKLRALWRAAPERLRRGTMMLYLRSPLLVEIAQQREDAGWTKEQREKAPSDAEIDAALATVVGQRFSGEDGEYRAGQEMMQLVLAGKLKYATIESLTTERGEKGSFVARLWEMLRDFKKWVAEHLGLFEEGPLKVDLEEGLANAETLMGMIEKRSKAVAERLTKGDPQQAAKPGKGAPAAPNAPPVRPARPGEWNPAAFWSRPELMDAKGMIGALRQQLSVASHRAIANAVAKAWNAATKADRRQPVRLLLRAVAETGSIDTILGSIKLWPSEIGFLFEIANTPEAVDALGENLKAMVGKSKGLGNYAKPLNPLGTKERTDFPDNAAYVDHVVEAQKARSRTSQPLSMPDQTVDNAENQPDNPSWNTPSLDQPATSLKAAASAPTRTGSVQPGSPDSTGLPGPETTKSAPSSPRQQRLPQWLGNALQPDAPRPERQQSVAPERQIEPEFFQEGRHDSRLSDAGFRPAVVAEAIDAIRASVPRTALRPELEGIEVRYAISGEIVSGRAVGGRFVISVRDEADVGDVAGALLPALGKKAKAGIAEAIRGLMAKTGVALRTIAGERQPLALRKAAIDMGKMAPVAQEILGDVIDRPDASAAHYGSDFVAEVRSALAAIDETAQPEEPAAIPEPPPVYIPLGLDLKVKWQAIADYYRGVGDYEKEAETRASMLHWEKVLRGIDDKQRLIDAGIDPDTGRPFGEGPLGAGTLPPSPGMRPFPASFEGLNVPRAAMPQISAASRGGLANFLKARGVATTEETVAGKSLKPTQAEFDPKKVQEARRRMSGTQRKLLISAEGYVLDGHHQWMAARFGDVDVIRLALPVQEALQALEAFPGTKMEDTTPASEQVEGALQAGEMPEGPVTPEQDARHAELEARYNAGTITPEETAEAQRLVDEAARRTGYDTRDGKGWWHGSKWKGTEFHNPRNHGFYFGDFGHHFGTPEQAWNAMQEKPRGAKMRKFYLRLGRSMEVPDLTIFRTRMILEQAQRQRLVTQAEIDAIPTRSDDFDMRAIELLRAKGIDSVRYQNTYEALEDDATSVIVFTPDQIKSAGPFTGVPLSQRFNPESPSILRAGDLPSLSDRAEAARRVDLNDSGFRRMLADEGLIDDENEFIDPEDAGKYVPEWERYMERFDEPLSAGEMPEKAEEHARSMLVGGINPLVGETFDEGDPVPLHNAKVEVLTKLEDEGVLGGSLLEDATVDFSYAMEALERIGDKRDLDEIAQDHEDDTERTEFSTRKPVFEHVVDQWGTTRNWRETGYLLPDGRQVRLSYNRNQRDADHREVSWPGSPTELTRSPGTGTLKMLALMNAGAIRIQGNGQGGLSMRRAPTPEQIRKLAEYFVDAGEIVADIEAPHANGYDEVARETFQGSDAEMDAFFKKVKRFYSKNRLDDQPGRSETLSAGEMPENLDEVLPPGTKRRDIWDLAQAGRTNAQIAEALSATPEAIESALRSIRNRLGVPAQLGPRRPVDPDRLSPQMRQVFDAYQAGESREATARRLGIKLPALAKLFHQIRQRMGGEIIPFASPGRTKYDWAAIDWTQSNAAIARQLGTDHSTVRDARKRRASAPPERQQASPPDAMGLPPRLRQVYDLFQEGKGANEIAQELGVSPKNVSTAIAALRKRGALPPNATLARVQSIDWEQVDWSKNDAQLAEDLDVSRPTVLRRRREYAPGTQHASGGYRGADQMDDRERPATRSSQPDYPSAQDALAHIAPPVGNEEDWRGGAEEEMDWRVANRGLAQADAAQERRAEEVEDMLLRVSARARRAVQAFYDEDRPIPDSVISELREAIQKRRQALQAGSGTALSAGEMPEQDGLQTTGNTVDLSHGYPRSLQEGTARPPKGSALSAAAFLAGGAPIHEIGPRSIGRTREIVSRSGSKLRSWAVQNDRWADRYDRNVDPVKDAGGREHVVFRRADGKWDKYTYESIDVPGYGMTGRIVIESDGSVDVALRGATQAEYFAKLAMFNHFYPEVAYDVVAVTPEGVHVRQADVGGRELAGEDELANLLSNAGWQQVYPDNFGVWYHPGHRVYMLDAGSTNGRVIGEGDDAFYQPFDVTIIPALDAGEEEKRLAAGELPMSRIEEVGRIDLEAPGFRRILAERGLAAEDEEIDPEDADKYLPEWREYLAKFEVPLQAGEMPEPTREEFFGAVKKLLRSNDPAVADLKGDVAMVGPRALFENRDPSVRAIVAWARGEAPAAPEPDAFDRRAQELLDKPNAARRILAMPEDELRELARRFAQDPAKTEALLELVKDPAAKRRAEDILYRTFPGYLQRQGEQMLEAGEMPDPFYAFAAATDRDREESRAQAALSPMQRFERVKDRVAQVAPGLGLERAEALRVAARELAGDWDPALGSIDQRVGDALLRVSASRALETEGILSMPDQGPIDVTGAPTNDPLSTPEGQQGKPPVSDEERERRSIAASYGHMRRALKQIQNTIGDWDGISDPRAWMDQFDAAMAEEEGQRTIGQNNAEYANPGRNEWTRRAVDVSLHAYRENLTHEDFAAWDEQARELIASMRGETLVKRLTDKVMRGDVLDRVETRAAMMLSHDMWTTALSSGDPRKITEAQQWTWVYATNRTAAARSLAAGRDMTRTPTQRAAAFVGQQVSRLSPEDEHAIQKITNPEERQKAVAAKQAEAWGRIEGAMSLAGISMQDLFLSNAVQALRRSEEMRGAIRTVSEQFSGTPTAQKRARQALEMLVDGWRPGDIAGTLKLPRRSVEMLQRDLREQITADLGELVSRRVLNGLGDFGRPGAVTMPEMTQSQRRAEAKALSIKAEGVRDRMNNLRRQYNNLPKTAKAERKALREQLKTLHTDYKALTNTERKKQIKQLKAEDKAKVEAMVNAALGWADVNDAHTIRLVRTGEGLSGRGSYRFDPESAAHITTVSRLIQTVNSNGYDVFIEALKAELLTGMITNTINATSAPFMAAYEWGIHRALTALVNAALFRNPDMAQFGELNHLFQALFRGIGPAIQRARLAWNIEHSLYEEEKLGQAIDLEKLVEHGPGRVAMSDQLWAQIFGGKAYQDYARERMALLETGATVEVASAAARLKFQSNPAFRFQNFMDKALGSWMGIFYPLKGRAVRWGLRLNGFFDALYNELFWNVEIGAQAYRIARRNILGQAVAKGLTGKALNDEVKRMSAEMVDSQIDPGPGLAPHLTRSAAEDAAKQRGLAPGAYTIQQIDGPIGVGGFIVMTRMPQLQTIIAEQMSRQGSEAAFRAVEETRRMTLTRELKSEAEGGSRPEQMMSGLIRWRGRRAATTQGKAGQALLQVIFKFLNTPYQVFEHALRSTPVINTIGVLPRLAAGLTSYSKKQGFFTAYPQDVVARDIVDHIVSTGIAFALMSFVEGDDDDDDKMILITGTRSRGTDKLGETMLNKRTEGPMMIRIGPAANPLARLDYSRIDPFGSFLAATTDIVRSGKRLRDGAELGIEASKLSAVLLNRMQSQPMLSSTSDVVDILYSLKAQDGRLWEKLHNFVRRNVTPLVLTNFFRQGLRSLDDYQRDTYDQPAWKKWAYDVIPHGGLWGIEPSIDMWGNPVTKQLTGTPAKYARLLIDVGLQPSLASKHRFDRFMQEFGRIHASQALPRGLSVPAGTGIETYLDLDNPKADQNGEVKMTPKQKANFRRRVGTVAAARMAPLVTARDLAYPTEERFRELVTELGKIDNEVRGQMFPSDQRWREYSPEERRAELRKRKR